MKGGPLSSNVMPLASARVTACGSLRLVACLGGWNSLMVLINEGSKEDKRSIPLATSGGGWIRNVRRLPRSPLSMREAEKYAHAQCPGIQTRSLSSTYNCFGLVFASRRTCIDTDQLPAILRDDGYNEVTDPSILSPGDIVVYLGDDPSDINHVGILQYIAAHPSTGEYSYTVLSQWGLDGEYLHGVHNVPALYGGRTKFFSERIRQ